MNIKIGVVTGNRAEYGLLYPLIREMLLDNCFEVHLIVTGTHLSKKQRYTIEEIKKDNIPISHVVDLEQIDDSKLEICNAISKGISRFSQLFDETKFDLIIVLGDRYELWSACTAAVIHNIPIAHIHGGEVTQGAIDEMIRHSITKMASIHFPSVDMYRRRIIQMGEPPSRVHAVGALGIDNIEHSNLMSIEELSHSLGVNFNQRIALMTYHPVTLDINEDSSSQVQQVLEALVCYKLYTIITMPNMDHGGSKIYDTIKRYVKQYPDKFVFKSSLGRIRYLSAMKYATIMIGNSSSGVIESASFKLPVVNIGNRQQGRVKPSNVIDCKCNGNSIYEALDTALSQQFLNSISNLKNPYGQGNTAKRIIQILKKVDFRKKEDLLVKKFYDL